MNIALTNGTVPLSKFNCCLIFKDGTFRPLKAIKVDTIFEDGKLAELQIEFETFTRRYSDPDCVIGVLYASSDYPPKLHEFRNRMDIGDKFTPTTVIR